MKLFNSDFLENLWMALDTLRQHKLRSLLTVLGVVVGTMTVIVIAAFVAGIDEDLNRQELLRALHRVAEKIGARIIGEGLDTLEELETLRRLGIPFGQGWLFGKPHPLRTDT